MEGAVEKDRTNPRHEINLKGKVLFLSSRVILKKSVASVINEKSILEELSHPFIINMKSYFQDRQFLYMTMEYLRGGDLRYHLCFYDSFSEEQTSNFDSIQNSSQPA